MTKQGALEDTEKLDGVKNYLFVGPAGTGKTTVARLMAKVLRFCGMIAREQLVVRTAQDLQGSHVGETAGKVNDAMLDAQGGVLFIDEAYALGKGEFGEEAMTQLVAQMTLDAHRCQTVVILAGYEEAIDEMLSHNAGMRSRFTERVVFDAWAADDCMRYFELKCTEMGLTLGADASESLRALLERLSTQGGWASARDCETTFRLLLEEQWAEESRAANNTVTVADVEAVAAYWSEQRGCRVGAAVGVGSVRGDGAAEEEAESQEPPEVVDSAEMQAASPGATL